MTGNGIASITKTSTSGLIDTYTITFTDGTTTTFEVTNGEDGEVTQAQFDDLEQRVEDAEKNQLTNTPEVATSHYLQDSADSRFRKFIPIGRTTQESTTGKNLWINEIENGETSNGIIVTKNKDGSLTFNGTATDLTEFYFVKSNTTGKYLEANQTYTMSGVKNTNTALSSACMIGGVGNSSTSDVRTLTLSTTREITKSNSFIRFAQGTVLNNYTIKPFIELGTTSGEYEPYTGGEPAPNPNYPIAIKNTGDNVNEFDKDNVTYKDGYILNADGTETSNSNYGYTTSFIDVKPNTKYTIQGNMNNSSSSSRIYYYDKNNTFISRSDAFQTINTSYTFETPSNCTKIQFQYVRSVVDFSTIKIEQGTITTPYSPYGCGNVNEKIENKNLLKIQNDLHLIMNSNGTISSGSTTSTICQILDVTNIDNLTFNGDFSLTDSQTIRVGLTNDFPAVGVQGTRIDVKPSNKTIDTSNYKYALCTFVSTGGSTAADIEKSFQIEEGSTATTYEAHSEQNISFPLAEGQKFYEGSYPDDDEKVHHKMGEYIFTGNEGFNKSNNYKGSYYKEWTFLDSKAKKNTPFLCSHATNVTNLSDYSIGKCYSDLTCNLWLGDENDFPDINAFEQYLAEQYANGTPVKIVYELAEEQTEDFTEEQKTAYPEWKKARTYKNVTHVSSEDETPANVEVEYVRDLETVINNLS